MTASAVRTEHVARLRVGDTLAGVGTMLRLVVRRNRVRLAVWWVVIVGLFAYVGADYKTLLTTQGAFDDFAALSNTLHQGAHRSSGGPQHAWRGGVDQNLDNVRAHPRVPCRLPHHVQRARRRGGRPHRTAPFSDARASRLLCGVVAG